MDIKRTANKKWLEQKGSIVLLDTTLMTTNAKYLDMMGYQFLLGFRQGYNYAKGAKHGNKK